MIPPKDSAVRFMLCDEVRLEHGNKLAILGFFPGGGVNLPTNKDGEPEAVPALTFIFLIEDGEGQFEATFQINDEAENTLFASDIGLIQKNIGIPAVAVVRVAPFKSKIWGLHSANIYLSGRRYTKEFNLSPA
ncbi:hypothetical protein [Methylobacterium sp. SI9]|uniref:hypothetical protein n=1 Tax=Methylobacterium guangdongense TaxID=3138811 RepID=UPI00313CDBA0